MNTINKSPATINLIIDFLSPSELHNTEKLHLIFL